MSRPLPVRRLVVGLCLLAVLLAAVTPGMFGMPWALLPCADALGVPGGSDGPPPGTLSCLPHVPHARVATPRGPPRS